MKLLQFSREVRAEADKVTWPNMLQTRGMTIAVLFFVTLMAVFLLLADWGMNSLVKWLLGVN
jgi:preprotein translocase SecE subunit